jgi:hypothetical protein
MTPRGATTRRVLERPSFEDPTTEVLVGLRSGAAWDREGLRALTVGVQLAWFPRPLGGYVGVALDGSGLAVREEERALIGGRNLEVSSVAQVFPLQGLALFRVPLFGGTLIGGAGGGSAYGIVHTAARTLPRDDVTGWGRSLTAVLGYGVHAGPGALFVEVRAQRVDRIADQPVPGSLELLGASLGYRVEL